MDKATRKQTVEIRGKEYDGPCLWIYMEEHKEEFTEQAVLKEIAEAQEADQEDATADRKINREFTVVEKMSSVILHERKEIYRGNALFMAIYFKNYDLARELISRQVFIRNGSIMPLYSVENAEPILGSCQSINLLALLLEDAEMPEDIWREVWDGYRKEQNSALRVFQPSQAKIGLWMCTLKKIKERRPLFFEEIVNEHFLLEFLWCYTMGYGQRTEKEKKQFCREWKKCLPVPKDMRKCRDFFLKELARMLSKTAGKADEQERIFCFVDLWKRVSGQKLVIDFSDPRMSIYNFAYGHAYNEEILDALLKAADEVKQADVVAGNGLFRYAVQEGERFRMALKKNLITKKMIPVALDYLKKNHPELIALLFLKQHGEL